MLYGAMIWLIWGVVSFCAILFLADSLGLALIAAALPPVAYFGFCSVVVGFAKLRQHLSDPRN